MSRGDYWVIDREGMRVSGDGKRFVQGLWVIMKAWALSQIKWDTFRRVISKEVT